MVNAKAGLENYSILALVRNALDRKNANEVVAFISEILSVRRYLFNSGEVFENEREDSFLVRAALERELLQAAVELLEKRVGRLCSDNEELFELARLKVGKRDNELLYKFVELYL
jgi:formyltetrahydrofolate hydrolase